MRHTEEIQHYKCEKCENEFELSEVFSTVKYCPYCGCDRTGFDVIDSDEPYDFI